MGLIPCNKMGDRKRVSGKVIIIIIIMKSEAVVLTCIAEGKKVVLTRNAYKIHILLEFLNWKL